MKATLAMLATGALCAAAHEAVGEASAVSTKLSQVPLLLWSPRPVFAAEGAYSNVVLNENKVWETLRTVLTLDTAKDATHVLNGAKLAAEPEALVVFLRKNLALSQLSKLAADGKKSFVESSIKSTSSVVLPHTTRAESLQDALDDSKLNPVIVSDADTWFDSADAKKLLSNGKNDLVVVKIPDDLALDKVDALVQSVVKKVGDNAIFALTGNEGEQTKKAATRRLATTKTIQCEANYEVGIASDGTQFCFSHYVHMTPNLLTGILFGGFFVFLAYIGITALNGIQTPARFPHHGPPKGKEF